jgi:hypothetical protein
MAKYQTNAIIKAIVAGGLDKTACTYDFGDDGGGRITHAPSGSSFLLEGDINAYTVTMTVGDIPGLPARPVFWPQIPDRVEGWATRVKDDMDTPNLLAELQRDREILTDARFEDVENTPFTPEEQAEIAEWVEASKEFVRHRYSLPEVQLRVIEAKLDELAAEARRSGRRDWMLGVCFVMIGVMANGLLPPDAVQHIVAMLLHGLGPHLGGGGPLGLPPGT